MVGPIPASNLSLAKGLAAERARQVLEDPNGPFLLANICDCTGDLAPDAIEPEPSPVDIDVDGSEEHRLDDETVEGFATLAKRVIARLQGPSVALRGPVDDEDEGRADDSIGPDDILLQGYPETNGYLAPDMKIDVTT